LRLLNPFAPHVTEELWEKLGSKEMLVNLPLPEVDPGALVKDVITVVVQVNGKLRGTMEVGASLPKEKILDMARENEKVLAHLEGKEIVKTIFVPGKLVNFVVK
jgi:leucyl-tRNA synthetase